MFQSLYPNTIELPCIFGELVNNYYNMIGLNICSIEVSYTWRHANSNKTAKWFLLFYIFISELANFYSNLSSYLICQNHYNQVVAKDHFHQQLLDNSSVYKVKKSWIDTNSNNNFIFSSRIREETINRDELHFL